MKMEMQTDACAVPLTTIMPVCLSVYLSVCQYVRVCVHARLSICETAYQNKIKWNENYLRSFCRNAKRTQTSTHTHTGITWCVADLLKVLSVLCCLNSALSFGRFVFFNFLESLPAMLWVYLLALRDTHTYLHMYMSLLVCTIQWLHLQAAMLNVWRWRWRSAQSSSLSSSFSTSASWYTLVELSFSTRPLKRLTASESARHAVSPP